MQTVSEGWAYLPSPNPPGDSTVKNLAACSAGDPGKIPWRKNWQPTPIFLPGESHGEPGELQPLGLNRVGHDLATKEQNCGEENHFSA